MSLVILIGAIAGLGAFCAWAGYNSGYDDGWWDHSFGSAKRHS